jgi:putative aldouronate transport system substrate-binding protein
MDPEWALNKPSNLNEKIGAGKVGLFAARWQDTRTPIAANKKNDPPAVWIPIGYPVGKDGKYGIKLADPVDQYNVVPVTTSDEKAEAVIKMLNFIVGQGFSDLKNGFENEIYTRKDGKMIVNDAEHQKHLYRYGIIFVQPDDPNVHKDRFEALGSEYHLNDNINMIVKAAIPNKFTGIQTPGMGKYAAKLSKLENEAYTKIIMGTVPISEFDKFVDQWKKEGGEEITKEVNSWFKSGKK